MPSFRTSTRFRVALALLSGALIGACSVSQEDAAGFLGDDGAVSGAGGYGTTGSGSSGTGGSLELAPDGGERDGAGGAASYAEYCGTGTPCTPGSTGESANCNGGSPGMGGQGGGGGGSLSCQLVPGADGAAIATCGPTGAHLAGDPCAAASDCAGGLGCVTSQSNGVPSGGQCRDYCCGDPEACPGGTYCALQLMAESDGPTPAEVPACIPATNCELLSDEPQCPAGTTCTIVREDGTTSCIEPGEGQACDPCPCAEGYVCSAAMNQCKKLCHTSGPASDECGGGYCQGGIGNFPDGIGVCTGGAGC